MLQQFIPWIGYAASLLLAVGLLVNNDLKFRWWNGTGCVFFIVYGLLLHAFPIVLTNTILLIINIYYLFKIYRQKESFELIAIDHNDVLIQRFLSFYASDIASYFPGFQPSDMEGGISFLVLRDLVIANIFNARQQADGGAEVVINYTAPKYRDFKVGKYIFEKEKQALISRGIAYVFYRKVANPSHRKFLLVSGFTSETIQGSSMLVKHL